MLFLLLAALPVTGQCAGFITDEDITDHLEIKFRFDPVVPFNTVEMSAPSGESSP